MKKFWLGCSVILLGIIFVMYIPKETKSEQTIMHPTVFVHGYKGTYYSFGNMLNRFENDYKWGHKGLVYQVEKDGSIHVKNINRKGKGPVYVQVVFEKNRASFSDSASYLSDVLRHMKENYHINSINLVGHSMGGIISLKFIEEYLNENDAFPVVQKYAAIGSPFNGIYKEGYFDIHQDAGAKDLMPGSDALQALFSNERVFPTDIDVLSIASTGDAVATPESVAALQHIIPDSQLNKILIEQPYLGHSDLHESKKVDQIVHSFLSEE